MRAARALLGIDQRQLAELSGVSQPTIQRMEASEGNVRGVVETLMKVVGAFERAGVELIHENAHSLGAGRGVRLKQIAGLARQKHQRDSVADRSRSEISAELGRGRQRSPPGFVLNRKGK